MGQYCRLLFENAPISNFVTAIYGDHQKMLSNVGKCPFDTALSSLVLTLPLLKELTLGVKLASSQKKMEIGDATQNYDPPVSPSHTLTRYAWSSLQYFAMQSCRSFHLDHTSSQKMDEKQKQQSSPFRTLLKMEFN